jgi:hypothetical protein
MVVGGKAWQKSILLVDGNLRFARADSFNLKYVEGIYQSWLLRRSGTKAETGKIITENSGWRCGVYS